MAIPLKDSFLSAWASNFFATANESPTKFGLTADQMTAFGTQRTVYVAIVAATLQARANGMLSKPQTAALKFAKKNLLDIARNLYKSVQSNTTIADEYKISLGVHVPKTSPSPAPFPITPPGMDIVSVSSWTVNAHIHDSAGSAKNRRPAGTTGAVLYSYVGETYPSDPSLWQYMGSFTTSKVELTFDNTVEPGSKVYLCAAWTGTQGRVGNVCPPVGTTIQGGSVAMKPSAGRKLKAA